MKRKHFTNFIIYSFIILLFNCNTKTVVSSETTNNTTPKLTEDIIWASPNGFDLTMDIYTPNTGKSSYPVIVMYHGGGWLINDNSIMDQSAKYLATNGEYIVCNVNYRLLGDQNNTVTLNTIIEDAYGALLWVKENIANYKGNPNQVIVTGDSAGGHLATLVATQHNNLSSTGFTQAPLGFSPTYLPKGLTLEAVEHQNLFKVQAAIISYGAFDLYNTALNGFESSDNIFWMLGNAEARGIFTNAYNVTDNADLYKKVSPYYNIPNPTEKKLPPMLFTVGTEDTTTTPKSIEAYIKKLKDAGHTNIKYWQHQDRPHAFLDSGSNEFLKINFEDDAVPALKVMISYLDSIFY